MATYTLLVKGMTCEGCERALQRALSAVAGVEAVRPDYVTGRVELEGAAARVESLQRAVEDAGFEWAGLG